MRTYNQVNLYMYIYICLYVILILSHTTLYLPMFALVWLFNISLFIYFAYIVVLCRSWHMFILIRSFPSVYLPNLFFYIPTDMICMHCVHLIQQATGSVPGRCTEPSLQGWFNKQLMFILFCGVNSSSFLEILTIWWKDIYLTHTQPLPCFLVPTLDLQGHDQLLDRMGCLLNLREMCIFSLDMMVVSSTQKYLSIGWKLHQWRSGISKITGR